MKTLRLTAARFWLLYVLAMLGLSVAWVITHAAVTGEWRVNLLKGTTTVQPHSAGATQEAAWAACVSRVAAMAAAASYTCQTPRYVATVTTAPPPACPPMPLVESRMATCPTGQTGGWTQTRSYSSVAAPTCWVAGTWSPTDPPVGACTVTPPPTGALSVLACRNAWGASDNCGGCSELVWSAPDAGDYVNADTQSHWQPLGTLPGTAKVLTAAGKVEGQAGQCVTTRTPVSELLSITPPPPPPPPPPPGTGTASLTWTLPTKNTDGSALTNLAGYRIVYGTSAGSPTREILVQGASVLTYTVDKLEAGTWFFSVAARSSTGAESAQTNTVSRVVP